LTFHIVGNEDLHHINIKLLKQSSLLKTLHPRIVKRYMKNIINEVVKHILMRE